MGSEQAIEVAREPRVHRVTVDEFLALDQAGFFAEVGRVELIDGEIIEMAPLHVPHARTLIQLTVAVALAVDEVTGLESLSPVSAELDRYNLPEADIIVVNRIADEDVKFVPAEAVRLLIEVAASSLRHDLGRKRRLYARSGVPEYWVADVNGRMIIRMHGPDGDAYRDQTRFPFGERVPAATVPGLIVDTARLA